MKARAKRVAVAGAKLAVTVALCYLVLREVEFAKLAQVLSGARWHFLLLPCGLYAVCLLIVSIKLKWLLQGYGLKVTVARAFDLNWIGGFFNNFLPSSVGGDVYRLYQLVREFPEHPAQVVAAVILDRGLGLLAMLVIAVIASGFFIGDVIPATQVVVAVYMAAAAAILIGVVMLFADHKLRIGRTTRYAMLNKVINGLNILLGYPSRRKLLLSLLLSFVFYGMVVASNYFLFAAFNADISLLVLLFVIPVVNLAAMIPISINAIGVTEGVGILLFAQFGYEAELVLGIMLSGRVLLMLCSATGGIPLLMGRASMPQRVRARDHV